MAVSCVICSELYVQTEIIETVACGHIFHSDCLRQWLSRSQSCPQCRATVTEAGIFRIFLNFADEPKPRQQINGNNNHSFDFDDLLKRFDILNDELKDRDLLAKEEANLRQTLRYENGRLKQQNNAMNNKLQHFEKIMEAKVKTLNNKIKTVQNNESALRQQLTIENAKLKAENASNKTLEKKRNKEIKALSLKVQTMQTNESALRQKYAKESREYSRLLKDSSAMTEQLQLLEKKVMDLEEIEKISREDTTGKSKPSQNKIRKLQMKLKFSIVQLHETCSHLQVAELMTCCLAAEKERYIKELEEQKSASLTLQQQISDLEKKFETLTEKNRKIYEELEKAKLTASHHENDKMTAVNEMKKQKSSNALQQKKIVELEKKLQALTANHNNKIKELQSAKSKTSLYEKQRMELLNDLKAQQSANSEHKQHILELEKKLNDLTSNHPEKLEERQLDISTASNYDIMATLNGIKTLKTENVLGLKE